FPKSKLSVTFSVVVLTAFVWQIGEGFLRVISDIVVANRIYDLIEVGALLLISSCFYFSLLFTDSLKRSASSIVISLIYVPALFLIIANAMEWIPCKLEYTSSLGYINVNQTASSTVESLYISLFGLGTAFLLIRHWIRSKN